MHYQFTLEIRTGILTHLLSIFPFDPPENIGKKSIKLQKSEGNATLNKMKNQNDFIFCFSQAYKHINYSLNFLKSSK